ncbi:hypothetical protein BURK1_02940 [Burkholderiales bacterium]|nr:hypothetical protein BURK1_02940 [Burkholderiales bacterium]
MRDFARRALGGFASGIGFAAAAGLAWLVVREAGGLAGELSGAVATRASARPAATAQASAAAARVRVTSHRVERRHGDAIVLGVLHNESDVRVGSVRVEAAHYDAAGLLVDLCGWYIAPSLAPGEDKPFKVSCGGTPERPSPEGASVRLRIVEAY